MEGCKLVQGSSARVFAIDETDARLLLAALHCGDSLTLSEWCYVERLVGDIVLFVGKLSQEERDDETERGGCDYGGV